ncbi:hypothetical protein R3P38DRAFT_3172979 [Favolaschia claudopus]|uniref:Uncharacterized protein n=1 Tax=Favolaschia claudopus TaxID=2862362 RepID=A0AAW0DNZ6_9AGAR
MVAFVAASPASPELELQARQSCTGNNGACGSALPACCSGLFCNTLNGVRLNPSHVAEDV